MYCFCRSYNMTPRKISLVIEVLKLYLKLADWHMGCSLNVLYKLFWGRQELGTMGWVGIRQFEEVEPSGEYLLHLRALSGNEN